MESSISISERFVTQACTAGLFPEVKKWIAEFELDNRQISAEQFLTISDEKELCGFIRTRNHGSFSELCSLGVLETKRGMGVAHRLVEAILEQSVHPVFIVTIIPDFFSKYGFKPCTVYPAEIADKLNYCIEDLPVPEKYTVIKRT